MQRSLAAEPTQQKCALFYITEMNSLSKEGTWKSGKGEGEFASVTLPRSIVPRRVSSGRSRVPLRLFVRVGVRSP